MSADSKCELGNSSAAQWRFPSLSRRSEREIVRYVAALVSNAPNAEDLVQPTALALWDESRHLCHP